MHHVSSRTLRFALTAGVIAAVLVLCGFNRAPSEQVLTFLGLTLTAYNVQSQAGQRYGEKTATKAVAGGSPPPGEPAA